MEQNKMISAIECILFVSGEAVEISKICKILNIIDYQLEVLIEQYNKKSLGLNIIKINNKIQLCTKPEYAHFIQKLADIETHHKLTQSMIETLSIIAYRQPITRQEIELIRGVNCSSCLNKLINLELIEEKGRKNTIGKPILYGTTENFLRYFNIESIEQLPNYKQLNNSDTDK